MRRLAPLMLAVCFALAACGGTDSQPNDPGSARPTVSEEPTTSASDEAEGEGDDSYGDLVEYAMGEQSVVPIDPETDVRKKEGVTVDEVTCKGDLLQAANNPEWDGSADIPQLIDVDAAVDMQFCVVQATVEAAGDVPIDGWSQFGSMLTDQGQEFSGDSEPTITYSANITQRLSDRTSAETLNPGQSVKTYWVYEIPADAKPASVLWPEPDAVTDTSVIFALD